MEFRLDEPREAAHPAIHYNCAPDAGRTGFSFERKHWCRRQARRKSANDPTAPSALADPGLVLVKARIVRASRMRERVGS
jgi:hypothetical protein